MRQLPKINNPLPPTESNRCRYCRCTTMSACDEGCDWADRQQTVCDTQVCLYRFAAALSEVITANKA